MNLFLFCLMILEELEGLTPLFMCIVLAGIIALGYHILFGMEESMRKRAEQKRSELDPRYWGSYAGTGKDSDGKEPC